MPEETKSNTKNQSIRLFDDFMKDGYGVQTASNGTVYDGEWKYGFRHGFGVETT